MARYTRYQSAELATICRGATKKVPPDQNSYPVRETLRDWKPMQRVEHISSNRSIFWYQGYSRAWTEVDGVHILFLTGWTRPPSTFVVSSIMAVLLTFLTLQNVHFEHYAHKLHCSCKV